MNKQEKNLNALLVDALNVWFAKEGLTIDRPKRENTRTFKIGRRHRVKYHKVTFKHTREIKMAFKVGNIHVYMNLDEWPPQPEGMIFARQRYIFKVIKLEPLSNNTGYITVEDYNDMKGELE